MNRRQFLTRAAMAATAVALAPVATLAGRGFKYADNAGIGPIPLMMNPQDRLIPPVQWQAMQDELPPQHINCRCIDPIDELFARRIVFAYGISPKALMRATHDGRTQPEAR